VTTNHPLECKDHTGRVTMASGFAGRLTRRSPCFMNATTEGVVQAPSEFSITRAIFPPMTETHEFVVP
jgi:hypothetical protein